MECPRSIARKFFNQLTSQPPTQLMTKTVKRSVSYVTAVRKQQLRPARFSASSTSLSFSRSSLRSYPITTGGAKGPEVLSYQLRAKAKWQLPPALLCGSLHELYISQSVGSLCPESIRDHLNLLFALLKYCKIFQS